MDDDETATPREPYEPPVIEDVPLRADEQLLAGCKQARTAGPGSFFCGSGARPCVNASAS